MKNSPYLEWIELIVDFRSLYHMLGKIFFRRTLEEIVSLWMEIIQAIMEMDGYKKEEEKNVSFCECQFAL